MPNRPVAIGVRARDVKTGEQAAKLMWDDASDLDEIRDPRTREFASAVIDGLSAAIAGSAGAVKRMMGGASVAAEDLNVGQFQGLVEVIQNADDVPRQ